MYRCQGGVLFFFFGIKLDEGLTYDEKKDLLSQATFNQRHMIVVDLQIGVRLAYLSNQTETTNTMENSKRNYSTRRSTLGFRQQNTIDTTTR